MIKIEANTIEEAYTKASKELECSVSQVDIEIVQAPTNGILGFFKKSAIVHAVIKGQSFTKAVKEIPKQVKSSNEEERVLEEIEVSITKLLDASCFEAHFVEARYQNENDIYLKIDGKDAPLLIGKEGYRYKAFSYLLYNLFKSKYNKSLKLEIAEFLEKQEEYVDNYLNIVRDKIAKYGRANTRVLDGVLLKLALDKLRAEFSDKYVGIKTNRDGDKYIVINNFNSKKKVVKD